MSTVKTAEEIGKLHALCEKAFADESGYGEVHSLSDRGIYRTFRDGFFAANRVLGKELRAELAELRALAAAAVPDDVAKDAERYRFLKSSAEQGAVRTLLPLTRCHYVIVNESAYDHQTFDSAVDAAIEFAILAAKEKGQ